MNIELGKKKKKKLAKRNISSAYEIAQENHPPVFTQSIREVKPRQKPQII